MPKNNMVAYMLKKRAQEMHEAERKRREAHMTIYLSRAGGICHKSSDKKSK